MAVMSGRECSFCARIDRDTVSRMGGPDCNIDLEIELYDAFGFPLVRAVLSVSDRPDETLVLESFLDITDGSQGVVLDALAEQSAVVCHWFDDDLDYVGTSVVP